MSTCVFVLLGLSGIWKRAHRTHVHWSGRLLMGTLLIGFDIFNVVEGIIDHHLLGIHLVNETVPTNEWIYWGLVFLAWGVLMLVDGWISLKSGERQTAEERADKPPGQWRQAGYYWDIPTMAVETSAFKFRVIPRSDLN